VPRSYVNRLRAQLGPLWPYLVLTLVPAAGFILPDLFGGHLLLTGDNLQQNYPLHVLVGSMLRHGQLPLWDPYIFSGAPLLSGFNSGAFYPLMGLFVILPDRVAWIGLEVILYALTAIGMYVYLRALALSSVACCLAAATFAFAGTVLSQVNHVDMTEGLVAIPWMLLAVHHIVSDGRWRWSVLLGIGLALTILGGAPEAMLDGALLIGAYGAVSAGFSTARWWRAVTRMGAGAVLGLSLAAIQWIPGLQAIANSERAGLGGGFASSGSFPPRDGLLALIPYLYGGFGHLGERTFFGTYNLPELGIYLGILPVIALLTLVHPSWPSRLGGRERLTWYLVGLFALLLALGANTPLEHLFNAIPLYGRQRLQSRNMVGVCAAVCVLFAGWLDRRGDAGAALRMFSRWVGLIPAAIVLGVAGWALWSPASLIRSLARSTPNPASIHTVREATLIALAFCVVAATIVWLRSRLAPRLWLSAVAIFIVVDLGLVAGTGQLASTPSNAVLSGSAVVEQALANHLVPGGRYELFDPQGYADGPFGANGLPDDNILAGLPSVGGYASLVNQRYSAVTETHSQGDLDLTSLAAGDLDALDLDDIVTVPEYFLVPLSGAPNSLAHVEVASEPSGSDSLLPMGYHPQGSDPDYRAYPPPRSALGRGASTSWFFGEKLAPTRATVLFGGASREAVIRLGSIGPAGDTTWGPAELVPAGARNFTDSLPSGAGAIGLTLQVIFGSVPSQQIVISARGRAYELDGALSSVLTPALWRMVGSPDGYSLLVRRAAASPAHVGGSRQGEDLVVGAPTGPGNSQRLSVKTAAPAALVRDVAWDDGWSATVSVDGGRSHPLAVTRDGLVQKVEVPAGDDVVTFRYRPPYLSLAAAITVTALAVLGALLALTLWRGRKRRRGAGPVA
jgi:hypothetical protein